MESTPDVDKARRALVRALGDLLTPNAIAYRRTKVIHDSIWGTSRFDPWETSLLDLGVFQRLRGLRQTGFANLTYPTAEHSRFQHSLGVASAAARVFDSLVERRDDGGLSEYTIAKARGHPVFGKRADTHYWRRLLRLAALVHDLGHSVFSHSSERIFGLVSPFPKLGQQLADTTAKPPGAAEIVVYLLITSSEWRDVVDEIWKRSTKSVPPPTAEEWERVGRWVMGQENERELKFLSDIISGPIDADKLDYIDRDGYASGIPVGYDLERLVSTVCVHAHPAMDDGGNWWRLTIPVRGVNALEQLVMGRLVLNSYLYHHHKCRAAETAFERALAREYLHHRTILGHARVWELFRLQDADAYSFSLGRGATQREIRRLYRRDLRVRVVEFTKADIPVRTQRTSVGYSRVVTLGSVQDWTSYQQLLDVENQIAKKAGLSEGDIILDVPKNPHYADLENLLLPRRGADPGEQPANVLNYRDWIEAYKTHRSFVRVFGPRDGKDEKRVWDSTRSVLSERFGLDLPEGTRLKH